MSMINVHWLTLVVVGPPLGMALCEHHIAEVLLIAPEKESTRAGMPLMSEMAKGGGRAEFCRGHRRSVGAPKYSKGNPMVAE